MSAESMNASNRVKKCVAYIVIAVFAVVVDQLSKAAIVHSFELDNQRRTLIAGVLDLVLVHNEGAAFSIGQGAGPIFVIVAAVFAVAALVFLWKYPSTSWFSVVCIALVVGGGLGNMIDRIRLGYVNDFFATSFIDFPVFNVADIFVTCGVVLLLISIIFFDSDEPHKVDSSGKTSTHKGA
ncbi:MAG: signal peptidase II [Atopobiaceae bacterium]|nr:signal peptidase II [Atopobiaceae bacterium]